MQTFKNIITDFSRLWLVLMTILVSSTIALSQPSVRMQQIIGCSNSEILIPVEVVNMQNIAALTLFIKVDTSVVEYVGVEDVNEAFSSGDFVGGENQQAQLISVNWFSLSPATIDSGLICNIRVILKGNSCNLLFESDCEFVNPDLTTVDNVEYIDGSILAMGSYVPDPLSQTVLEGSDVNISLSNVDDSLTMNWQRLTNQNWVNLEEGSTYHGVETASLLIHLVTKDMNESMFRCLLSNNMCSEGTKVSELYVTPNSVISNFNQNHISVLKVFPNPVNSTLNCKINSDILFGKIVLKNAEGRTIRAIKLFKVHAGENKYLEMSNLKAGTYFVSLLNQQKMVATIKVIKE